MVKTSYRAHPREHAGVYAPTDPFGIACAAGFDLLYLLKQHKGTFNIRIQEMNLYMPILGSKKIITLFHGSIDLFTEINILKGKPYKDFGKGFYTTQNRNHAVSLALRNQRIEEMRLRQQNLKSNVNAYLYTYELDTSQLTGSSVKEFRDADKDWVLFVLANRRNNDKTHTYDIIIGPTADDDTRLCLRAYFAGAYGEVASDKAINTLLDNIEPDNLPQQIYFGRIKQPRCCFKTEGRLFYEADRRKYSVCD